MSASVCVRIPHSPNLFFVVSYALFLLGCIQLNAIIHTKIGYSFGAILNVMCLCAAIHFALLLPKGSLFKSEWKDTAAFIKHLFGKRVVLALTFGTLAAATDIVIIALVNDHFNGATLLLAPERYVLIGIAYSAIAYVFIGAELKRQWKTRPISKTTDTLLTSLYCEMSAADRSAIKVALQNKSNTLNAAQNSGLDTFLKQLTKLGLAQTLERALRGDADTHSSEIREWKISDNGLKTIRTIGNLGH